MPELPEVETVRRGLEPVLTGARIARAEVRRPDLRWPFPPGMADRLTGARVTALRRRSKYILADLDTAETLLIHLGMSGRMTVSVPDGGTLVPGVFVHGHPPDEKHDHVVLETDAGARITFNDARRFGAMDLFPLGRDGDHKLLATLGPEPLGNAFDGPALVKAVSAAAKNIDQVALELSDIDPEEDEYLIGKYGDLLKNPAYNRIYKGVYYMGTGIASLIQKKEAVAA